MASLDILCYNPFNLKNKIMKIEHKKILRSPSEILKNISWPINICLKCFMAPTKNLCRPPPLSPPSYVLNVRSLNSHLNTDQSNFPAHKTVKNVLEISVKNNIKNN